MSEEHWLERLETLIARFSYLGVAYDLGNLTKPEIWALYLHLSRLVDS
ncbi:hypothetical protein FNL37_0862 [Methylovorus glucosotrophus]|nr:hypothetical protein FNL37_0862 [Methylovorus glucosotrophus]